MGRNCKACGEPVENGTYWCSDACWRDEDGGYDDLEGPQDDEWINRAYMAQAGPNPARGGYYDGGRLRY